jgi:hypothetical protein
MFEVPLTTSNVGAVITKTDFSNMFWWTMMVLQLSMGVQQKTLLAI